MILDNIWLILIEEGLERRWRLFTSDIEWSVTEERKMMVRVLKKSTGVFRNEESRADADERILRKSKM